MMLGLMLCCVGCVSTPPAPTASIHQGPLGNAVLISVPAGTVIQLPNAPAAQNVQQALANEVRPGAASNTVTTIVPLKIATPSYIAERDMAEMQLLKRIKELQILAQPK